MSDREEKPDISEGTETSQSGFRLAGWVKMLVILAVIVGGLLLVRRWIPVRQYLESFLKWTEGAGVIGAVVLGITYIIGSLLLFPGSFLSMGAGFLYGLIWGTVIVSLASTATACLAFLIGRTVGRGWVAGKISGNKKFSAVDKAVGQEGFKIVFLVRLSPLFPFTLQNYAFGLTDITFWKYALASWIGMLPGTVMYVYFGVAAKNIAEIIAGEATMSAPQKVFLWVGLAVTIVVVVFVTRLARSAIKNAMADAEKADETALDS